MNSLILLKLAFMNYDSWKYAQGMEFYDISRKYFIRGVLDHFVINGMSMSEKRFLLSVEFPMSNFSKYSNFAKMLKLINKEKEIFHERNDCS